MLYIRSSNLFTPFSLFVPVLYVSGICTHMYASAHTYVDTCRGQRRVSGILYYSPSWFLTQGLSMNWKLPAQMADLQDPGIHLSLTTLPPQVGVAGMHSDA